MQTDRYIGKGDRGRGDTLVVRLLISSKTTETEQAILGFLCCVSFVVDIESH